MADTVSSPPPGSKPHCEMLGALTPASHPFSKTHCSERSHRTRERELSTLWGNLGWQNAHTPKQAFFDTPEMCHQSPTQLRKMQRDLRAHPAPTHKPALNPGRDSVPEFGCRGPKRAFQPESRQQYLEELSGDVRHWVVFLDSLLRAHDVGYLCFQPTGRYHVTTAPSTHKSAEISRSCPAFNFKKLKLSSFIFFTDTTQFKMCTL